MRAAAQQLGYGQWVSLIPELVNPKDLFSLIRPDAPLTAKASTRSVRRPELATA
jgi:hypothetical protein